MRKNRLKFDRLGEEHVWLYPAEGDSDPSGTEGGGDGRRAVRNAVCQRADDPAGSAVS